MESWCRERGREWLGPFETDFFDLYVGGTSTASLQKRGRQRPRPLEKLCRQAVHKTLPCHEDAYGRPWSLCLSESGRIERHLRRKHWRQKAGAPWQTQLLIGHRLAFAYDMEKPPCEMPMQPYQVAWPHSHARQSRPAIASGRERRWTKLLLSLAGPFRPIFLENDAGLSC